jgi:hypothetical protein
MSSAVDDIRVIDSDRLCAQTTGYGTSDDPDATDVSKVALYTFIHGRFLAKIMNAHLATLKEIEAQGIPAKPRIDRTTAEGSTVLETSVSKADSDPSLKGVKTYVYVRSGCEVTTCEGYKTAHSIPAPGACVVLGAGNQPFLCVTDALHMLFIENRTVLIKYHDIQVSFGWPPHSMSVFPRSAPAICARSSSSVYM